MKTIKCPKCSYQQTAANYFCLSCKSFLNSGSETKFSKNDLKLLMGIILALTMINTLGKAIWNREERMAQITAKSSSIMAATAPQIPQAENEKANTHSNQSYAYEKRRKFAFDMQMLTDESKSSSSTIRNVRYSTEGSENDVLVLKAEGVSDSDCRFLAYSEYGKLASTMGFHRLICRNSYSGSEWSIRL